MAILTDQTTNLPGGLSIGNATPTKVTNIRVYSQSLVPTTITGPTITPQTFTVTGLTTADKLIVNPPFPSVNTVQVVAAQCNLANNATLFFAHPGTGALTPLAGTYVILAIRS